MSTDQNLENIAANGVDKYTKIINDLMKQLQEKPDDDKLQTSLTDAKNMLDAFSKNTERTWDKVERNEDSDDDENWKEAKAKAGGRKKTRRRRNRKSRRRRRKTQYKRK